MYFRKSRSFTPSINTSNSGYIRALQICYTGASNSFKFGSYTGASTPRILVTREHQLLRVTLETSIHSNSGYTRASTPRIRVTSHQHLEFEHQHLQLSIQSNWLHSCKHNKEYCCCRLTTVSGAQSVGYQQGEKAFSQAEDQL